MEIILLAIFSAALLGCVFSGISILAALVLGFLLFFGYGLARGHGFLDMSRMALGGISTVKNILITFLFIGLLTASWRASGSIAYIVYHASGLCSPGLMILLSFLLCSLISFLTGTAFGTGATMGVICMTMALSIGISPVFTGGAILAGCYFGDRCSPVSTSALLVSELTGTDLFGNIKLMIKTSFVPFVLSCGIYLALGLVGESDSAAVSSSGAALSPGSTVSVFAEHYVLSPVTLIPVIIVLGMSLLRINVKATLLASTVSALAVAIPVQGMPVNDLPSLCVLGFRPESSDLAALMSGGGLISMVRVFFIVMISSCYSGMFEGTGFLRNVESVISSMSLRLSRFGTILVTSLAASAIACNQTLAIMLTHQLTKKLYGIEADPRSAVSLAIDLENTAVVIAPLVPWSIAGAVVLDSSGAPASGILAAFYLMLLPVWNLLISTKKQPS